MLPHPKLHPPNSMLKNPYLSSVRHQERWDRFPSKASAQVASRGHCKER